MLQIRKRTRSMGSVLLAICLLLCLLPWRVPAAAGGGEAGAAESTAEAPQTDRSGGMEGAEGEAARLPIDVVLVLDRSGSMLKSDPDNMVMGAVQAFANMMPAMNSRLGIVGFTDTATLYTPDFINMSEVNAADQVKAVIQQAQVDPKGDTASGNALAKAEELFESKGRPADQAERAILLFTDGVDDLDTDDKKTENETNLDKALLWASGGNVAVYPIGFNYQSSDGKDSLDGNGQERLKKIADETGGDVTMVTSLDQIEDQFSIILAKMCELRYKTVGEVPGDGGHHEIPIDVTSGVVEMNIRIACKTADAISNGSLTLTDPDGHATELSNSDTVRYDLEQKAASIKVLRPKLGKWTLAMDGITGDSIRVGLLNHYSITLSARLDVPDGNEADTGYVGQKVGIVCQIIDEKQTVDKNYYKEVTDAKATVTPKDGQPEEVKLAYSDGALRGEYAVTSAADCSVHVEVASDYYDKTADLVLHGREKPLSLTGAALENQSLQVGQTTAIRNLMDLVQTTDAEHVSISVKSVSSPSVADAQVDGTTLNLTAKAAGETDITLAWVDQTGKELTAVCHVSVRAPITAVRGVTLENRKVNVGDSLLIDGLSALYSNPGHETVITTAKCSNDDVTVVTAGDVLTVTGKKAGTTKITVTVSDTLGTNLVNSFTVTVHDLAAERLHRALPFMFAAGAALLLVIAIVYLELSKKVSGRFSIGPVRVMAGNRTVAFMEELLVVPASDVPMKKKTTMDRLFEAYINEAVREQAVSAHDEKVLRDVLANRYFVPIADTLRQIVMEGSVMGKSGFRLVVPEGLPLSVNGGPDGAAAAIDLATTGMITLEIAPENGGLLRIRIIYDGRTDY